ncbi:hypothetical protein BDW59DRAFT_158936 [Aspergillus cavernicola]|uniref:Uncharacterized protein n=1 Tax=Aspergillus cavernicola TaxID=176166 RepID=A0ABR4IPS0_9EURO
MLAIHIEQLMIEDEYMKKALSEWAYTLPGCWPDDFFSLFAASGGFAFNWACRDLEKQSLTQAQKKQLVRSLDGYCVQEDFDSIISRLSSYHQKMILSTFTSAFLVKTAIGKFFQHPFWYVEIPSQRETREEAPWLGVSYYGTVLEEISSRFEEVNPVFGRIWRSLTTRLCTSLNYDQAKDRSFGEALQALRHARCRSLASEILADKIFQCLLKPTDDPSKREDSLSFCLAKLSDIAVGMLSQHPVLKFHTLHELEPRFHHASKGCYALKPPFISRTGNVSEGEVDEIVVFKAAAILEEQRGAEEDTGKSLKISKKN